METIKNLRLQDEQPYNPAELPNSTDANPRMPPRTTVEVATRGPIHSLLHRHAQDRNLGGPLPSGKDNQLFFFKKSEKTSACRNVDSLASDGSKQYTAPRTHHTGKFFARGSSAQAAFSSVVSLDGHRLARMSLVAPCVMRASIFYTQHSTLCPLYFSLRTGPTPTSRQPNSSLAIFAEQSPLTD